MKEIIYQLDKLDFKDGKVDATFSFSHDGTKLVTLEIEADEDESIVTLKNGAVDFFKKEFGDESSSTFKFMS